MATAQDLGQYVASVRGHYIDMDRVFGAQCWDQWAHYATNFLGVPLADTYTNRGGFNPHPGYACNVYHNARAAGLEEWFEILPADATPQPGDVAFWEFGSAWYPLSHVATVLEVVSGSMLRCLTQNPTAVQVVDLIRRGVIGYLRPRAFQLGELDISKQTAPRKDGEDMTTSTYWRPIASSTPVGNPPTSRIWAGKDRTIVTKDPQTGKEISRAVYSDVFERLPGGEFVRLYADEWAGLVEIHDKQGDKIHVRECHGNLIESAQAKTRYRAR